MRPGWGLLLGVFLLLAVVNAQSTIYEGSYSEQYGCENAFNSEDYRFNVVAEALLRAISLVAPSSSFAKKVFRNESVTYFQDLRWLYRDGVGSGETHTYILWGEIMVGLAMVWLLITLFFYLPLMCFKWLRRRCCPFSWKRPRSPFLCSFITLAILAPIATFLVAVAILYSIWFYQDFSDAKCTTALAADALYFGNAQPPWIGFESILAVLPPTSIFANGVESVYHNAGELISHLADHDTGYKALGLTLIIVSALTVLGIIFAIQIFIHYWQFDEYENPIRRPGGFHTNFAGFLIFGYAFWGCVLLAFAGVGFAFLYFPGDLCRVVQLDLLENGKWNDYPGLAGYMEWEGLSDCLMGETEEVMEEFAVSAEVAPQEAVNELLGQCGRHMCLLPSCNDDPNAIPLTTLKGFSTLIKTVPFSELEYMSEFPVEFQEVMSCVSTAQLTELVHRVDNVVPLEEYSCASLNELMTDGMKVPCNMLGGDLGALAWIYLALAILHFVVWIFIVRFYKARRRLMDGLKGDQSGEPEPIVIPASGGSNRITEDAFLLAAEQGDLAMCHVGMATYQPNTVYDLLYNNSPLHLAAYYGHEDIVEALLQQGYNPNDLNFHDYTPFSACASNTYLKWGVKQRLLQRLHKENAELDTFDHQGDTPLINATRNKDEELVKLLLDMGANPTIRDTMMGLTPLAVAETQRSPELIHLISEASPRGTDMISPKRTRFSESDM